MSTWFDLDYSGKCLAVEVSAFTERTVTVDGRRRNRISDFHCFFPTFDEAKSYAIERAEEKCRVIRSQLERANGDLGRIKGMKSPLESQP